MTEPPNNDAMARCSCGSVELEAAGAPIMSVACYCDDCQEGGRRIEALANAPRVRDPDGGTAYALYRKDRMTVSKGAQFLHGDKLKEQSATSRMVATCCNSAMFVKIDGWGHWVSVYRARLQGHVPPLQMRIQTRFKPASSNIPGDVPSYATFPLKFMAKLLGARIAMLIGR